jgi:hypothetical protein
MANEITYQVAISASKSGAVISSGTLSDTVDMTGGDVLAATQNIGTSNEQIDVASIANDCRIVIKNLDATNYVEVFKDSGNTHLLSKLAAGEACLLTQVPSATLYARANTAACDVMIWACEV